MNADKIVPLMRCIVAAERSMEDASKAYDASRAALERAEESTRAARRALDDELSAIKTSIKREA